MEVDRSYSCFGPDVLFPPLSNFLFSRVLLTSSPGFYEFNGFLFSQCLLYEFWGWILSVIVKLVVCSHHTYARFPKLYFSFYNFEINTTTIQSFFFAKKLVGLMGTSAALVSPAAI